MEQGGGGKTGRWKWDEHFVTWMTLVRTCGQGVLIQFNASSAQTHIKILSRFTRSALEGIGMRIAIKECQRSKLGSRKEYKKYKLEGPKPSPRVSAVARRSS